MLYSLKNCRNGESAVYPTTVEITEKDNILTFRFTAAHSSFYCPHEGYNKIHSEGDACEVLIGSDPARKTYFEIEISANGDLMLAEMTNYGDDEKNEPILGLSFIDDCFIKSHVERSGDGYIATISFDKRHVLKHGEDIYFNAYRLETDGGEMDKHLFALFPTMKHKFHVPAYFSLLNQYVSAE